MKKITVVRFEAICGKQYQSSGGCKSHEKTCKCFTNPKYKACHSCHYNEGLELIDGERFRKCAHPDWDYDRMEPFNIPNTATFDCINCPFYLSKEEYHGDFVKWVGYGRKEKNRELSMSIPSDDLPF